MYDRIELFVVIFAWFVGVPSLMAFMVNFFDQWKNSGEFSKLVWVGLITAVCWAWIISGWFH